MSDKKYRLETLAIHAGYDPDETCARAVPVHRTSSYVFRDTEHAANLFGLKELGNIYTRLMNPTQNALEQRVAAMYGAPAALAASSGTAATHYSIINICQQGDHVVSANDLYGGTYTMFDSIHPQFGIETTFVDPTKPENFDAAVKKNTRAIFVETCANPELKVPDFDGIAEVAKKHHLPLICDNTFATSALFNPFEHGVNIVVDSLTKWMGGHGTGIGGIMVDGANFDWTDEKFALFNEPDASYHGIRYARDLGDLNPVCFAMRARLVPMRNLGACLSPDNAWMFMQGIETLPLRMKRHCDNALAVANHLRAAKGVEWVKYPGFEDHPTHANAKKYLKGGFGGMVVFGIEGGEAAGRKFIEALELFSHLANVGDAKSLAIHPWSTTHSQLNDEQKKAGGITPELVRLSVGIEHIDDLLEDIDQALAAAAK